MNLSSKTTFSNGSITNLPSGDTLAYDCEGNLACVSNAVSGAVSLYWYDQHGRRIAKQENGLLTLYIWDGMDIIATAHADGTIREYFTRGIGIAGDVGSLIAETRFSGGTATTTYLHSNWRGDVVMATDAAGNVVGEYAYTTFGEQLSSVGDFVPRFTFSSKERDASGLVYFGFRYYSPVLCRWIFEDPIGEAGGINLYEAFASNPVNFIDPYGDDIADYNWDWLYNSSDALAGFGDVLSFGGTEWLREQLGYDGIVEKCSKAYRGGRYAGIAHGIATGGGRLLYAGTAKVGSAILLKNGATAANAAKAVAFRNGLKNVFNLGLNTKKPLQMADAVRKYGENYEAIIRAAGRTATESKFLGAKIPGAWNYAGGYFLGAGVHGATE